MDALILELAARAGPLVILSGLFLFWDHCRAKFAAERWARRDEEFNGLVEQMTDALRDNAKALREFSERMAARPCLLEESRQRVGRK